MLIYLNFYLKGLIMGFQKRVNIFPDKGVSGTLWREEGFIETPLRYVSDGTVEAGRFAFLKEAGKQVACKAKASAKLLGLVIYTKDAWLNVPLQTSSVAYPVNNILTIAQRGSVLFKIPKDGGSATDGQSVLCNPDDGAVSFGAAGTANDTGWVVHLLDGATTAKAGDWIVVQNIGLNNKTA